MCTQMAWEWANKLRSTFRAQTSRNGAPMTWFQQEKRVH